MANYVKVVGGYQKWLLFTVADTRARACLVSGNEEFQLLTQVVLQEDVASYSKQIKLQLKENMGTHNAFNAINAVQTAVKWNIKRVIYRSTFLLGIIVRLKR